MATQISHHDRRENSGDVAESARLVIVPAQRRAMKKKIILLLALPLYACGSSDKAPTPKTTPVDPRILLKCAGPLAFTHTGVVTDRVVRKIKSEEAVYRIDLAHNIIEVWDEIGQEFEPLCRRNMTTCKINLGSTKFKYSTSEFSNDNDDNLSISDITVIDRLSHNITDVSKLDVRRNHRLISTDTITWTGKCVMTGVPLPITSTQNS
jgi:hypothetical protein